jgi:hypothetical protein
LDLNSEQSYLAHLDGSGKQVIEARRDWHKGRGNQSRCHLDLLRCSTIGQRPSERRATATRRNLAEGSRSGFRFLLAWETPFFGS